MSATLTETATETRKEGAATAGAKPAATVRLSGYIPELDGIRGIAIGMVVFYHYLVQTSVAANGTFLWYALMPGRLGWTGVDFFFVLSGFLIGGILMDARESRNYFQVFYRRRFFRIVPIYAVFLAGFFALVYVNHANAAPRLQWITSRAFPWYAYAFFLQNAWMAVNNGWGPPISSISWSLAVEEQFYLTLPWLVRFLNQRRLKQVVVEGLLLAPILRIMVFSLWPRLSNAWFVLMPCRADALLFGVLVAMAMRDAEWRGWLERRRMTLRVLMVTLAAGIPVLTQMYYVPYGFRTASLGLTWIAAFYATVLVYALIFPGSKISWCLRIKWLKWLGAIAYGTYLFHQLFLHVIFGAIWGRAPVVNSKGEFAAAFAALALTLVFCRISWRWFETPLIEMGHRTKYASAERVRRSAEDRFGEE